MTNCPVCQELTDTLIETDRVSLCCLVCFERAIDNGRQTAFLGGFVFGVFTMGLIAMAATVVGK